MQNRHPALDNAVFGLALVLALILAYYGVKKLVYAPPAAPPAAVAGNDQPSSASDADDKPLGRLQASPTERAVSSLPPIRLMRTGTLSPDREVPPPEKKD